MTEVEEFEEHRSRLTGLAYRIIGSRSEAEDIVHETYLKWFDTNKVEISSPRSWLIKVATRLSLDHLKSARVQRVSYIGPWLPEPFIEDAGPYIDDNTNPESSYELDESISMALIILLDSLSPGERTSFILHDIFNFSFDEISNILEKTSPTCRKLASRARDKVKKDSPKHVSNIDEYKDITTAFFLAIKKGNLTGLVELLKENVTFHADGGGKAVAALEVLKGRDNVISFIFKTVRPGFVNTDSHISEMKPVWFNGVPGFVIYLDRKLVTAFNFIIEDGVISRIFALRNPEKLRLFDVDYSGNSDN